MEKLLADALADRVVKKKIRMDFVGMTWILFGLLHIYMRAWRNSEVLAIIEVSSTGCYHSKMKNGEIRVFKTAWFAKAAGKSRIGDLELCTAVRQVMQGQADDLGGGVFKKRLNDNMHRSIILAKGGRFWVYEFLFAKKDRDNIEDNELAAFRSLAKIYERLTEKQVSDLLVNRKFLEICDDHQTQV
ncbi:MAG: type II toxin-antitoxin system RelE/ParE family toxin [Sulfurimicrobium sp.]|nr:type II toxin-antitoxin system RelE/ParE family toxin [Sulfurimicrobium sp.]MDP2199940.1 type II toxin-antitoxin system RelE/ParE family toxin [Sulfurimicrobium sp.]